MKIRIAVAVGPDGKWRAFGTEKDDDTSAEETALMLLPFSLRAKAVIYWITAEVPVPQSAEIEGRVQ